MKKKILNEKEDVKCNTIIKMIKFDAVTKEIIK